MYRQGDVLLVPMELIPAKAKAGTLGEDRIVLALGEATGHSHVLEAPGVRAYTERGALFVRVPEGGASLNHEEHAAIKVPPGQYRVVIQREYTPGATRRVSD